MKNEKLIKYLKDELDYSAFEIKATLREVKRLDKESAIRLDELLDGKDITGYSFRDYSVNALIKKHRLNYISAIIAISDLKKDYAYYSELYGRPIK